MDNVVLPPSKNITALCNHCDLLIEEYLHGIGSKPRSIGRYESEVEFYTTLKLMLRHLEAICLMARHDLVLAPSAHVIARSLFETSIRARWMFIPVDIFEKEVRWLLFFRTGTAQSQKLASNPYVPNHLASNYRIRKEQDEAFDDAMMQ